MDPIQHHVMITALNNLLLGFGGTLLSERLMAGSSRSDALLKINSTALVVEEMAQLTARWASDLKHAANHLTSPIHSIPVEILHQIISLTLQNEWDRTAYYHNLYKLRRVSKLWYLVINSMPNLWRGVTSSMPGHAVTQAIQNSQRLPLSILFGAPEKMFEFNSKTDEELQGQSFESFMEQLLGHRHRWGALSIITTNKEIISTFLEPPAPCLTSLALTFKARSMQLNDALGRISDGVLEDFMSAAPSLEDLQIEGWPFDWTETSHQFTSLRTLGLCNLHGENAPVIDDLLRMVSCCPRLQHLDLLTVVFLPPTALTSTSIHLQFPALETLDLNFGASAHIILNALAMAPKTSTRINGLDTGAQGHVFEVMLHWITHASAQWECPGSVLVRHHGANMPEIQLGDRSIRFSNGYGPPQRSSGYVKFDEFDWGINEIRIALSCLDARWRASVTTIGLLDDPLLSNDRDPFPASDYIDLMADIFPGVTRLELGSAKGRNISEEGLGRLAASGSADGGGKETWLFPFLQELDIIGPVNASCLENFTAARLEASERNEVSRMASIAQRKARLREWGF